MDGDHYLLIRMDEKMDSVLKWQKEHQEMCHADHTRYEADLGELKAWKYKETGALILLGVLINVALRWVFR